MKPFLSIIIPAYNEEKRLPLTLLDMDKNLEKAEFSYEIIVVDDGSKDATVEIVKRMMHAVKNLHIIENSENHGKGWVVRKGMLEAQGNWRLFTDADNSTSIDQVGKMFPYFSAGRGSDLGTKGSYDVIIGSRGIKGAELHPPQPWYKQILGKLGNLFIQVMVLWGITDTQCGFKCFSEESAERVFKIMKIDRWGFDVEALALAKKFGYRIKEVPVYWVNDFNSKVSLLGYLSTFWEVMKIKWWFIRDVYGIRKNDAL